MIMTGMAEIIVSCTDAIQGFSAKAAALGPNTSLIH